MQHISAHIQARRFPVRLLTFAMALLLFCLPLCACGNTGDNTETNPPKETGTAPGTPTESETSGDETEPITPRAPYVNERGAYLVRDGESPFSIVRSDTATQKMTTASLALRDEVNRLTGASLALQTDWDESKMTEYEILVGKTTRTESKEALSSLPETSFTIRISGTKVIVLGTTEELTRIALTYFMEHLTAPDGQTLYFNKEHSCTMTYEDYLMSRDTKGSTLKLQYSDYLDTYDEQPLLSFDEYPIDGLTFSPDCTFSLDSEHQKEGDAALRCTIGKNAAGKLTPAIWYKANGQAFRASVTDLHKATLKIWLYIGDITKFTCDHDSLYGVAPNQATFFFRVMDRFGGTYCWNHTVMGSGWHECELSFNIHNGVSDKFDYQNITGFGVLCTGEEGAYFELDDLRLVTYETDYTQPACPNGGRWISTCDDIALDGPIIQEWYGAYFNTEDKVSGRSSFGCRGDDSCSDFRAIIANVNVPLDYDSDVLVFSFKSENMSYIKSLFIELNQEQDVHEYQNSFTIEQLKQYGLKEGTEWSRIAIPLTALGKNLNAEKYGASEDITLRNARFVATAADSHEYEFLLDEVYITAASNLNP